MPMKKIIFTLFIAGLFFTSFSQTTKPPGTPPRTPPSPAVMKKDFDAAMADLNDRIATLQRQINAVNGKVNAKDNNLDALQSNIDTLNKILQSMNIKVSLTSDSLSITSYTISDLKKKVDDDIAVVNESINSTTMLVFVSFAGLAILLIALIVFFILLNRKISKLSNLEDDIAQFMDEVKVDFDKMKNELKPAISKEVQASQTTLDARISRTRVELIDMIGILKHQNEKSINEIKNLLTPTDSEPKEGK